MRTRYLLQAFLMLMLNIHSVLASEQVIPNQADAGWDDDWDDNETSNWQLTAFTEGAYGRFLQNNIVDSQSSLAELRGRFELKYSHDLFVMTLKQEALADHVVSDFVWHTRELNVMASLWSNLDVKIGRQILTWGTGDYLFLNDLFAKNWQAFFSGREDEYLKSPSDSLRLSWYLNNFSFEMAWTPDFTPDIYLTGERFSFYSPQLHTQIAPAEKFDVLQTLDQQWAGRISSFQKGVEYALYAYQGNWTTPQGVTPSGQAYFPKLTAWGASVRLPFADGVLNSEFSYYMSKEDRAGVNPDIANDQLRFLLGYEQELIKNLTAGIQYYLEKTMNYGDLLRNSLRVNNIVNENRHLLTLRLRYSALQQKLTYSIFVFYSPTDSDSYIRPSITYRVSDRWSYSLGANLFSGKDRFSFFGQHEDNSNIWLRGRYQF